MVHVFQCFQKFIVVQISDFLRSSYTAGETIFPPGQSNCCQIFLTLMLRKWNFLFASKTRKICFISSWRWKRIDSHRNGLERGRDREENTLQHRQWASIQKSDNYTQREIRSPLYGRCWTLLRTSIGTTKLFIFQSKYDRVCFDRCCCYCCSEKVYSLIILSVSLFLVLLLRVIDRQIITNANWVMVQFFTKLCSAVHRTSGKFSILWKVCNTFEKFTKLEVTLENL